MADGLASRAVAERIVVAIERNEAIVTSADFTSR
jgi:hypothetical protein